jgi:hypothetical protein
MHVDRSRFLFLTASLAAAACNQPEPAASPDTGGAEPAKTGQAKAGDPQPGGGPSVWLEIEPGTEDRQAAAGDCDNTAARARPCTLSPPSSHCESFDSTVRLCQSFAEFMQPRAAEAAIDCMLAASGSHQICDWQIQTQCTGAGIQATCVEPATRSECDSISSQCGGSVDVFSCQQALSSVKPQHTIAAASCIREFCEIPFCVMDIGWR